MAFAINPLVDRVLEPPTAETRSWVASGAYNRDLPLIDASQAVPNYPPAQELMEHLAEAALEPETAFYTPILGIEPLREALAADLSRGYGAAIDAGNVAITNGGNHAFCMALLALAAPGDEVILPSPFYFNHQMWFEMQGIAARSLPCRETAEGLVPEVEEAEALIGERTRAIVLVSPNNPTGTIYSAARLKGFYDLARRHGLALVVDETYKDFLPDGGAPHDLFREHDWQDVFVLLYSFSKVYSLTGYRVGALAGGDRFMAAIGKIADTLTICPPHIGQRAALYGLTHLRDWTEDKRADLLERQGVLRAAFSSHAPPFRLISCGAFFAYIDHPFGDRPSLDVARQLLADASLVTWPGSFFGPDQDRYIRLAFANARDDEIEEIVWRLTLIAAE
ncbi:MAG: aminotransferase [Hyphomicrobiales bacterium]